MRQAEFQEILTKEGFDEVVTVQREANGSLAAHSHPFEAKALVVDGELSIATDECEEVYRVGDVFHLAANVVHRETYGPQGVKYLVGRK